MIWFAIPLALTGAWSFSLYRKWVSIAKTEPHYFQVGFSYTLFACIFYSLFELVNPGAAPLDAFVQGAIVSFMLIASIIDYETMYLPDELTLPLILMTFTNQALGLNGESLTSDLVYALLHGLVAFTVFWIVDYIHFKRTGNHGLGGGDAKLLASIAILLGFIPTVLVLIGAASASILHHFVSSIRGRKQDFLPFGPGLAFSFLVVWVLILGFGKSAVLDALGLPNI